MNNQKANATLFFDTRQKKSDGTFPVKLNIYFAKSKKRYSIGIDLIEEEWKKVNGDKLRDDRLRVIKRKLSAVIEKAERIIDQLSSFSFDAFELAYFEKVQKKTLALDAAFNNYIQKLEGQGRIGSADVYKTTLNSIQRFKPKTQLTDITHEFLQKYEAWMTEAKASSSTIGIYLRHLRAIINIAIENGLISREKYPFRKYSIPSSRNVKKALSNEDLNKLREYVPQSESEQKAHDFWMLSYYCNGMNMKDICLLQWKDVETDFLFYIRAKTKNTKKKDLRPIKVVILDEAKVIIERQQNMTKAGYVFPILTDGLTPRQLDERVHTFIKFVNNHMDIIRQKLEISMPINTYAARHSHATVLKRNGASTEEISENLGHSSLLMTKQYLGDFTDEAKKKTANLLTKLD